MRYLMAILLTCITVAVTVWLLAGFITLSWSMLAWSTGGRAAYVFLTVILCAPLSGLACGCLFDHEQELGRLNKPLK